MSRQKKVSRKKKKKALSEICLMLPKLKRALNR